MIKILENNIWEYKDDIMDTFNMLISPRVKQMATQLCEAYNEIGEKNWDKLMHNINIDFDEIEDELCIFNKDYIYISYNVEDDEWGYHDSDIVATESLEELVDWATEFYSDYKWTVSELKKISNMLHYAYSTIVSAHKLINKND